MSLADEIERLQQLRDSGALTDDEFAQAKAALLSNDSSQPAFVLPGGTAKWLVVGLHLSQFAGYAAPLAGFVVLIVLAILGVVFPIVGAIKASQGVCWSYPLTIQFLSPSY